MRVKCQYNYYQSVIPPRCRKPRPIEFHDELDVDIEEVNSGDAPIAIVGRVKIFGRKAKTEIVYRWHRERLWSRLRLFDAQPDSYTSGRADYEHPPLPDVQKFKTRFEDRETVLDRIAKWTRNRILIDSESWRPAGEPRYVVATFGLGHNHSGTALLTTDYYNSNFPHGRYFSLLEEGRAIAEAERIALARGDTKSVPIGKSDEYEIVIKDAIRIDPKIEHGEGDPFLNAVEGIVQSSGSAFEAGLLTIAKALRK